MDICIHNDFCGGCKFQGVPYEEQLAQKEAEVRELLRRKEIDCEDIRPIQGSPAIYAYRNKMEYTFGDLVKDGPLTLGMHKKGQFMSVVTVDSCQLVPPEFNRILRATLDFCESRGYCHYHKKTHRGLMRNLVVRKGMRTEEVLVNIVTSGQEEFDAEGYVQALLEGLELPRFAREEVEGTREGLEVPRFAREEVEGTREGVEVPRCAREGVEGAREGLEVPRCAREGEAGACEGINIFTHSRGGEADEGSLPSGETPHIVGILRTINDDIADAVKPENTKILYGRDHYFEELCGLRFKVGCFSFFQTNVPAAERLYLDALSLVEKPEGKVAFDLFSGTGTITQLLAQKAKKAVGVELVGEAVEAARENAKLNGLENCEFYEGDVFKVLETLSEKPDIIVVDPPRAGITPKALEKIASYGVPEILYISCNPKTLAENLYYLKYSGYEPVTIKIYDNFPFTKHVECAALLLRVRG